MHILDFVRDSGNTDIVGRGVLEDGKIVVVKASEETLYSVWVDGICERIFIHCEEAYLHKPRSGEAVTWDETADGL